MRSNPRVTISRLCIRPVLCWLAFPLAPPAPRELLFIAHHALSPGSRRRPPSGNFAAARWCCGSPLRLLCGLPVTRDSACVALGFEDDVTLTSASKPRHKLSSDMSSSRAARPLRKRRVRQSWNTFSRRVRRWRGARWARRKLAAAPSAVRIAFIVAMILAAFSLANLLYQVVRKPTELLFSSADRSTRYRRNLAAVRTTLPRVRDRHHHARAAGGAGAGRARAIRWRAPIGAGG